MDMADRRVAASGSHDRCWNTPLVEASPERAQASGACVVARLLQATRRGDGALIDVLNADQRTTPQPKASRLPRASKKD
jgi:hypothetical protein